MQLCKHKCHLKLKSYRLRTQRFHPVHEEAKRVASEYTTKIEKAKKKHWEDWLEDINTDNVWTAHKYAGGAPRMVETPEYPCSKHKKTGNQRN